MCKADQAMRFSFQDGLGTWDETMDYRHTARMKEIAVEIGWPTIGKVGEEGSTSAWLLAQHADHDPEFQKKCLALMKAEPAGEVARRNIAYLEDRVAVGGGKPQIYGTQFRPGPDDKLEPSPIEDPENVDQRRQVVGLGTLEEGRQYLQRAIPSAAA